MILSATCGLLGALAAQADSGYSVNVVGYVNKSVKAANNVLIANPLNSTNTLASLFPGFTDADGGSEIYAWNTTTLKYDYYTYVAGFGWMNGDTGDDASSFQDRADIRSGRQADDCRVARGQIDARAEAVGQAKGMGVQGRGADLVEQIQSWGLRDPGVPSRRDIETPGAGGQPQRAAV